MANFSTKSQNVHITLTLHWDSHNAIHLVRNPFYHAKKKHIEVRYRHSRKIVIDQKLEIQKFDTEVNITDLLTKSLPDYNLFRALRGKMGLEQEAKPHSRI